MSTHEQLTPGVSDADHVDGPADAAVTLVEYGDYQCPSCGMAYPIVHKLRERYAKRLRFVFRNFPLREMHEFAEHAAECAEAVGDIGGDDAFWAVHDILFENQEALDDESLVDYAEEVGIESDAVAEALDEGTYEDRVRSDFTSGIRSGVNGTPTFFINGVRFDGNWQDAREFGAAIEAAAGRPGGASPTASGSR